MVGRPETAAVAPAVQLGQCADTDVLAEVDVAGHGSWLGHEAFEFGSSVFAAVCVEEKYESRSEVNEWAGHR